MLIISLLSSRFGANMPRDTARNAGRIRFEKHGGIHHHMLRIRIRVYHVPGGKVNPPTPADNRISKDRLPLRIQWPAWDEAENVAV